MARRTNSRTRRSTRSTSRSSYRARPTRSSYKPRSRRTGRRTSSAARTVRIVIEQAAPSDVQRPGVPVGIGLKTAPTTKTKSRF